MLDIYLYESFWQRDEGFEAALRPSNKTDRNMIERLTREKQNEK